MKRTPFLLVTAATGAVLLAQTADLTFEQLTTRYETALVQIRADSTTSYSNLLAGTLSSCQKKGDLDGYEVALKERKRFDVDKALPTSEQRSVLAGRMGDF